MMWFPDGDFGCFRDDNISKLRVLKTRLCYGIATPCPLMLLVEFRLHLNGVR